MTTGTFRLQDPGEITRKSARPENLNDSIADMTVAELNDLLKIVHTRHELEVHEVCSLTYERTEGDAAGCIHYRINVENSYRRGQYLELHMHKRIPSFVRTVEDFYDWCLGICLWFDDHEGREAFKVNGFPWRDPHIYAGLTQDFVDREVFDRVVAMRVPRKQAAEK